MSKAAQLVRATVSFDHLTSMQIRDFMHLNNFRDPGLALRALVMAALDTPNLPTMVGWNKAYAEAQTMIRERLNEFSDSLKKEFYAALEMRPMDEGDEL